MGCTNINVDVNGFKGPNIVGKDIFAVHVLADQIKPFGIPNDDSPYQMCDKTSTDTNNTGFDCSLGMLTN